QSIIGAISGLAITKTAGRGSPGLSSSPQANNCHLMIRAHAQTPRTVHRSNPIDTMSGTAPASSLPAHTRKSYSAPENQPAVSRPETRGRSRAYSPEQPPDQVRPRPRRRRAPGIGADAGESGSARSQSKAGAAKAHQPSTGRGLRGRGSSAL